MYKKIISLFIFITFNLLLSINVDASSSSGELVKHEKQIYGYLDTVHNISIWDDEDIPSYVWTDIEDILIHIENTFSRTDENSELYYLNQKAGTGYIEVSQELYDLIKQAVYYATITEGKFDPTVGPLINLWDQYTADVDSSWIIDAPSQDEINAILPLVDYKLINFEDETTSIKLEKSGMVVDLGSIAKGYAADLVAEYIKSKGYEHAIVNLGGNILTIGDRHASNDIGSNHWMLKIKNPKYNYVMNETKREYSKVYISDEALVSSGTYERYWIIEDTGVKHHHILDPSTGQSVHNEIELVSIISKDSTTADALSTSVFALGLEKGLELIESLNDVQAIFVTYDKEIYVSSGIGNKNPFRILDPSFKLAEGQVIDEDQDINIEEPKEPISTGLILGIVFGGVVLIGGIIATITIIYRKRVL